MQQCPKCKKEYPKGVEFCPKDGTRTIPASPVKSGVHKKVRMEVGNYTLIRKLGEGGMGVVFEAEHKLIQKRVALKMLHADKALDNQVSSRFVREAKISSQIKSPHIVDITDFGTTEGGELYLVMEFLEGKDLGHYLEARGQMEKAEAQHILHQSTQALAAAHKAGVIHRDLKPDNIFLIKKDGDARYVKLLDFGIAKQEGGGGLTKAGMIIGTPEYMAPEQCEGRPVDARSDIYSLGIIAYQMFTGKVPFSHEHFSRVLLMHSNETPPAPRRARPDLKIPVVVEATIMKCLEKRPEDRYQSMEEFGTAIRGWGQDAPEQIEEEAHTVIASIPSMAMVVPAPQPTMDLLALGEEKTGEYSEDDDATHAGGDSDEAMSLSSSMIAEAHTGFANQLPPNMDSIETAQLGSDATLAPGMAAPKPVFHLPASLSVKPAPAKPAPAKPAEPASARREGMAQQAIETTALPRIERDKLLKELQPTSERPRSRLPVIIVSALLVAVTGAVGLYFFLKDPSAGAVAEPPKPPSLPTSVASQPAAVSAPVEAETFKLEVKARPSDGIEVRLEGASELLGTLPGPIVLPKGDQELRLEFSKKGYQKAVKTIIPDQDQDLSLNLIKEKPKAQIPETPPSGIRDPFGN